MIIATHATGLYSWQEIRRRSHDHRHTCNGANKSGGVAMITAMITAMHMLRIAAPAMLRLAMLTCGKFESVRFACMVAITVWISQ